MSTKQEIKDAFESYVERIKENIKAVGLNLIDQGEMGADPFQHFLLALSKISQAAQQRREEIESIEDSDPGNIYN